MGRDRGDWIFWTPRVLAILFVLYLSMFALDFFENPGSGFLGVVLSLFVHFGPVFVLVVFLILSWKWEMVGAIGFALIALFYMISFFASFEWIIFFWMLQGAGPAVLIAILFFVGWKRKRR
jgi:hypothetical protein